MTTPREENPGLLQCIEERNLKQYGFLITDLNHEDTYSDYVKVLLTSLILCKSATPADSSVLVSKYRYVDLYRGFFERDKIVVPKSADDYLIKLFGDPDWSFEKIENLLRKDFFDDPSSFTRNNMVYNLLKSGLYPPFLEHDDLEAQVENEVKDYMKGSGMLRRLILDRRDEGVDVRDLSGPELEELNDNFDVILRSVKDSKGDGLTYNTYLLLYRSWALAYDVFRNDAALGKTNRNLREERRYKVLKTARDKGFGRKLYPIGVYPSLCDVSAAVYQFCTTYSTFSSMQSALHKEEARISKESLQPYASEKVEPGRLQNSKTVGPESPRTATPLDFEDNDRSSDFEFTCEQSLSETNPQARNAKVVELIQLLNTFAGRLAQAGDGLNKDFLTFLNKEFSKIQHEAISSTNKFENKFSFVFNQEDSISRVLCNIHYSLHYLHSRMYVDLKDGETEALRIIDCGLQKILIQFKTSELQADPIRK
jgi:hypothetical protein